MLKLAKYNHYILTNYVKDKFKIIKKWTLFNNTQRYQYKEIYIEAIMNLLFHDIKKIDRILFIDLTYTCEYLHYLNLRIKNSIDRFHIFFKNKGIKPIISVIYSSKYNKIRKDETYGSDTYFFKEVSIQEKQDFIYFSGGLEYFLIKSIYYYSEQMHSLYLFFQIFYILSFQKKGGSFIIYLQYII